MNTHNENEFSLLLEKLCDYDNNISELLLHDDNLLLNILNPQSLVHKRHNNHALHKNQFYFWKQHIELHLTLKYFLKQKKLKLQLLKEEQRRYEKLNDELTTYNINYLLDREKSLAKIAEQERMELQKLLQHLALIIQEIENKIKALDKAISSLKSSIREFETGFLHQYCVSLKYDLIKHFSNDIKFNINLHADDTVEIIRLFLKEKLEKLASLKKPDLKESWEDELKHRLKDFISNKILHKNKISAKEITSRAEKIAQHTIDHQNKAAYTLFAIQAARYASLSFKVKEKRALEAERKELSNPDLIKNTVNLCDLINKRAAKKNIASLESRKLNTYRNQLFMINAQHNSNSENTNERLDAQTEDYIKRNFTPN